jgi:AhpD family alkylhydroperoxidase
MPSDAQFFYEEWAARMSHAKSSATDIAKAFGSMYQTVMKDGTMSVREKELIAVGIRMAVRCDACIYTHAEKAIKAGATRQQVVEAAGVAVMMQGGPTYTYLPKLVEALDAIEAREPVQPRTEPALQETH